MDEIQQKLSLIDDQLAGRTVRERLVSTAPLFLPAVGLMAGILLQDRLASIFPSFGAPWTSWIWLAASVSAAIVMIPTRFRSRLGPQGIAVITSFCFLCLGATRMVAFDTPAPSDIRHLVGSERVLATIRGRIVTQPYQQPQDWCFARFTSADPPTAFYLAIEAVETSEGWTPVTGTVRVRVDEPAPNLRIGDYVQADCWLHRYEEPTNPGQFNVAKYLRLKNVHVGASVPTREAVIVLDHPRGGLTYLRKVFTAAAVNGLLDHPPSDTQGEAMLEALLLGERRNIAPDTREAFRRTGLLHLISLSGMHLCILIDLVWRIGKSLGLAKRARATVCMAATLVFLLVVPPHPPILRATVIVWSLCLSILLRRQPHPVNSLSLAAIVLLLIQPTQLFDVGWQLSFAATGGILAFARPISARLHAWTDDRLESPAWQPTTIVWMLKALGQWVLGMLAVGVAAWLGITGVLLYHFYNITPLASVWTILAVPWVIAIVTLGFLKIVLSFLLPTASILLGYPLNLLANQLIAMVRLMAKVDPTYLLIGHVPLILVLLYYVLILTFAFLHLRRPRVKQVLCAAMLLTLAIPLGVMKWQRTHRDQLCVTCLDVGHGQAILARLPGTTNVLFDAGSLFASDIGTRIVLPFLDYEGVGRLHAVIVSHRDIDHINGLPEIVDRRKVDCVYFDPVSFSQSQEVETVQALMNHLAIRGVSAKPMPDVLDAGPAEIRVLWPTSDAAACEQLSDNDRSLVCSIEYADKKVLLCSDVEKAAQGQILALYPELKADIVVAPHHGSVRTLHGEFLDRLEPNLVLCSCSERDCERGRILKTVPTGELRTTARDGAITICIDNAGMIKGDFSLQR